MEKELGYVQNRIEGKMVLDSAKYIARLYVDAAKRFLKDGDYLKDRIIDFYENREETINELCNLLGHLKDDDINKYVSDIKRLTESELVFVERMEKVFEIMLIRKNIRESFDSGVLATDEEYNIGTYINCLEQQVRDAVLTLNKKGYITFQSGFRENSERDQFIDFYNLKVEVSIGYIEYLKSINIEIKISNLGDRTTVVLHPVGSNILRLSDWKDIWDKFAEDLPQSNGELVKGAELYTEHSDFRRRQDKIRMIKQ